MDLEELRVFCDLAEARSFSKAAAMNRISQSAVSQKLKLLEGRLRLQLVDRTCRPLALTQAGQIFYQGCKEISQRYEELGNQLAQVSREISGSVTIAGIASIVLYVLQPYIRHYLLEYPTVRLRIEPMRANQAIEAVLQDRAEVAMIASVKEHRRLTVIKLHSEPLKLVCHPDHPLAKKDQVSIKDLQMQPAILFERDQPTRKLIDEIFKRYDVKVRPVMELDNIETMKRGIEANVGLSILPEAAVRQEVSGGSLMTREFKEENFSRPVGAVYRRGKTLTEPVRRLLELLSVPIDKLTQTRGNTVQSGAGDPPEE